MAAGQSPLPDEAPIIAELEAMGFHVEGEYTGWGYYNLDDSALRLVKKLRTISYLDLFESCDSGKATDMGLANLRGNISLEMLRLGPGITDAGLAHIAGLVQLKELRLDSAEGVTDVGTKHLAKLTNLERLSLQYTQVGDTALAALANLRSLKELNLEATKITTAGVTYLQAHKNLEKLWLAGIELTDEAFDDLDNALPTCDVLRD